MRAYITKLEVHKAPVAVLILWKEYIDFIWYVQH